LKKKATKKVNKPSTPKPKLSPKTPKKNSNVLFRRNEKNELLIMHLKELDAYYCIDGIAADLYELLDGKASIDSIVTTLAKRHKTDHAFIAKNTKKLIAQLSKLKLLQS
jgi:hypothetical protein